MKSKQIALGRPDNWTVWGLSRKSQQFFLLFPFFLRPFVVEILHSGRSQRSVCYQPAIKIQSAVGLIHEQSPLVANWNNLDTSLWLFIKGSGTTKIERTRDFDRRNEDLVWSELHWNAHQSIALEMLYSNSFDRISIRVHARPQIRLKHGNICILRSTNRSFWMYKSRLIKTRIWLTRTPIGSSWSVLFKVFWLLFDQIKHKVRNRAQTQQLS